MKKVMFYLASFCVAALAVSCEKAVELTEPIDNEAENQITEPTQPAQLTTITCAFPKMAGPGETKVSLETTGKTQWEVGDKIVIYGNPSSSDATKRVVHEIVAADIADPEVAVFDVDLSGLDAQYNSDPSEASSKYYPYTVAYPYTDGQQYYLGTGNNNYGRSRFENTNQILMAGHVSDDNSSIILNHLTAAITFSVKGDFDSYTFSGMNGNEVVGYSTFVVEMNRRTLGEGMYRQKYNDGGTTGDLTSIQGSVNGDGTSVNHIFLPVNADRSGSAPNYSYDLSSGRYADIVYLPNGFTIRFYKGGELKKYISSSAPLVIEPGHMINLGELPAAYLHDYVVRNNTIGVDVDTAYDLSSSATANCYLLDDNTALAANKAYKFRATKGKGGAVLTNINDSDDDNDVVVLWETNNTNSAPSVGDIIAAVDYEQEGEDAYIVFKMPKTITPGNAVIAAKNSAGDILWSWHIWVPETTVGSGTYGFAPTMMDRNLGALVVAGTGDVRACGLMYQWGRKDPFLGRGVIDHSDRAAVAGTSMSVSTTELTYAEAVKNPTMFSIAANGKQYHWIDTYDYTLWGSSKTVNDPCPPGWRVPHRDETNFIFKTDFASSSSYTYDSEHYCVTIYGTGGSVTFPFNGRLYYTTGAISDRGNVYMWSSKCADNGLARWLRATSSACTYADERAACAIGVRCIAE